MIAERHVKYSVLLLLTMGLASHVHASTAVSWSTPSGLTRSDGVSPLLESGPALFQLIYSPDTTADDAVVGGGVQGNDVILSQVVADPDTAGVAAEHFSATFTNAFQSGYVYLRVFDVGTQQGGVPFGAAYFTGPRVPLVDITLPFPNQEVSEGPLWAGTSSDSLGRYVLDEQVNAFQIPPPCAGCEIAILGTNGTVITNGSFSASASNGTDFGSVIYPGLDVAYRTFVITNSGSADLAIPGIYSSLEDFGVVQTYPTNLSPHSASNVTVFFHPLNLGPRFATIAVVNSDGDEGLYQFGVIGFGYEIEPPTPSNLVVRGTNHVSIVSDFSPSVSDGTDFGAADIATGLVIQTFFITNPALSNQSVQGVTTSGVNAADYAVLQFPGSVPASGSSDLVIRFTPSGIGLRSATITVASDPAMGFAIQGTGQSLPDSDNDGLPDAWEARFGFDPYGSNAPDANADTDASTDIDEYIADTNPTNSGSVFPRVALTNQRSDTLTLVVTPTSTGRVYGVRWSTNLLLTPQSWTPYGTEATGTGNALEFTVTNDPPARSYRSGVRLP